MRPRQGVRVLVRTGGQRGWVLLLAGFGLLAVIGVSRGGGDDAPVASPDAAVDRVAPGGLPAPLPGESASGGSPTGQLTITDPPPDVHPVPARPGANGVPALAQEAYQRAERMLAVSAPACRLSWTLLAAIGRAESGHAAGGRLDATGHTVGRILGPRLDGSPGLASVPDTDQGQLDGDQQWDRAVGPMQIVPSIWRRYGADGDGDGKAEPDDLDDAALTAGRYLCAAGTDLTDPANQNAAVLRYRNSPGYAEAVRNWAAEYARAPSAVPPSPLDEQPAFPRPGALEPPAPRALPDAARALPDAPRALPEVPRALPDAARALPSPPRASPKPPLVTPRTRAVVPAPRRSAPSRPTTIRAAPSSPEVALDQDDTTPAPSSPAPSTARGGARSSAPSSSSGATPTPSESPTSPASVTPTEDPPTGPKIVMLPSIPENAPGGQAAETLPTSSVRPTPTSVPLPSSTRRPAGDE